MAPQQQQQQKPKSANSGATSRRRPAAGALSGAATRVGVGAAHVSWGGSGSGNISSAGLGGAFGAALAPCGDYNGAARLAAPHTIGSLGPASVRVTPSSSAHVPANTPHLQQQQRGLFSNPANACESDCLPIIVGTAGGDCNPAVVSSSPSSSPSVSPRRRRPRGGDDYGGRLIVDCHPSYSLQEPGQGKRDGRASGGFAISFGVEEEGAAPVSTAVPPVFFHTPSSRLVVAPAPSTSAADAPHELRALDPPLPQQPLEAGKKGAPRPSASPDDERNLNATAPSSPPIPIAERPLLFAGLSLAAFVLCAAGASLPQFSTHTNAKSTAYYSNEVVTTSLDFYLFGLRIRGAEVDALAAASAAALDSAATFPDDAEAKGTAKGSNAEGSQLHGGGKSRGDEGIAGHQKHSPPDTVRHLDVLFPPTTDDASSADRDSRDVFSSSHSSHFSVSDALLRDPAAAAHSVCPSSSTATSSSPAALLVAMATRILGTDWRTYDGSRAAFAPRCPSLLWRL